MGCGYVVCLMRWGVAGWLVKRVAERGDVWRGVTGCDGVWRAVKGCDGVRRGVV